jgi:penicillin-binding protein 1A
MNDSGSAFSRWTRQHLPAKPWQLALIALFGLLASAVVILTLIALILTPTLPALDDLSGAQLKVPLRVYTAEGMLIAEFGEERRIPVTIDQVPEPLVNAILAAEDDSFYFHQGVDFQGIARAAWKNWRSGVHVRGRQHHHHAGGAQLFPEPGEDLHPQAQGGPAGVQDRARAHQGRDPRALYQQDLSRQPRLRLRRRRADLLRQGPERADAAGDGDARRPAQGAVAQQPAGEPGERPAAARLRVAAHAQAQSHRQIAYDEAVNAPLAAARHNVRFGLEAPYVAEMARQYMFQAYAESSYAGGYNVYTTIRAKEQEAAQAALRRGILDYDRRHGYRGPAGREKLAADADTQRFDEILRDHPIVGPLIPALVTAVEEKSASLYLHNGLPASSNGPACPGRAPTSTTTPRARRPRPPPRWSGAATSSTSRPSGRRRLAAGPDPPGVGRAGVARPQYRRGDRARRRLRLLPEQVQPRGAGRAPARLQHQAVRVLGGARKGLHPGQPDQRRADRDRGREPGGRVAPEDYSRQFYGPTRLRKALALSLNLVAVRLLRAIEPEYAVEHLARFGFDPAKLPPNLSLVLGTLSATPLQMTSAFAVLANGGYRVEPYFITRIEDANGRVLERSNPAVVCPVNPPKDAALPAACLPQPPTAPPAAARPARRTRRSRTRRRRRRASPNARSQPKTRFS